MRRSTPWLLVVVVVGLAYPVAVLAGGGPTFPSREDCARPPFEGGEIEAVFGRFDGEEAANELRTRAVQTGFSGVGTERDGCGRVKVVLHDIPSLEVGREFAEEARAAGFQVTLEQAG